MHEKYLYVKQNRLSKRGRIWINAKINKQNLHKFLSKLNQIFSILQTQKTFRFISAILFKQSSKGIKTALKLSQSNLILAV